MSDIQQIYAKQIDQYEGYDRVVVYYAKNGRDQHAVYMNYGSKDNPSYKIIEDNAVRGNRLTGRQSAIIGAMIDNEDIMIIKKGE